MYGAVCLIRLGFKDIYTLEKDNFADLALFLRSVLEMGQVLVLKLISPVIATFEHLSRRQKFNYFF